jgi:predicted aldo/keto reductase-like oxidoreductase
MLHCMHNTTAGYEACMLHCALHTQVVEEYRKAGKVRWIGFSTHAYTGLVVQTIETGKFDYVNLHYHFVGSYTSSGTWQGNSSGNRYSSVDSGAGKGSLMDHGGNYAALQAAKK